MQRRGLSLASGPKLASQARDAAASDVDRLTPRRSGERLEGAQVYKRIHFSIAFSAS
jgi:hypothetical protein